MRFAFLRERRFYHAASLLVGTMVGVGVYGIPFAFAKSGFFVGALWLVIAASLVALFDVLFAELTLSTQGVHQVTGYVNIWLGPWARRIATVAHVLTMYGALLAYIIVVGEFLHAILSNFISVDPQMYSIVFAGVGSFFWVLRVRTIASIESGVIVLYSIAIALVVLLGIGSVRVENFSGWTPEFWYLPYGVILFALAGITAIPIQRRLLTGYERLMRPSIVGAIIFTVGLYLAFAFVVVGVSGDATSPSALAGLFAVLGTPIVILGSLLGVLTITTSYIMLGTALVETFHIDYRQRLSVSWFLALLPPLILFSAGLTNFIDIIGLIGAVGLGVECALLLLAYNRARRMRLRVPEFATPVPSVIVHILVLVFFAGVLLELFYR